MKEPKSANDVLRATCVSSTSKQSSVEESKKKLSQKSDILLRGVLRKKGKIFNNEREVTISQDGILNYYHFDKPGVVQGTVDLASMQVLSVRFIYHGGQSGSGSNQKYVPDIDDQFRILLANRETYIFRASKVDKNGKSPSIEKWESVIRRFTRNVIIGI